MGDTEYIPLSREKLVEGTRLPFNIYIKGKTAYTPYFNSGMVFSRIALDLLAEKGISDVYVAQQDRSSLMSYLSRNKKEKTTDYEEVKVFKEYSHHKESNYQIDKTLLLPGLKIPFSLFLLNRFSLTPLIEATEKSPATITNTIQETNGDVVIKMSDIPLYNEYLNSLAHEKSILPDKIAKIKAISVRENSKLLMKDILDDPRSGEKMKQSTLVVNQMIDGILENKDAIYDLLSLRSYDYYTYTHSVNVAVLSIGLSTAVGMDRDVVEKLGMGAMLHDIGKSAIPPNILNKQGKLDEAEFRLIQNHVVEGEKILLTHRDNFPWEALPAVLQHHEKLSGKGYPLKLKGPDIHNFGKIAAIADCYDALTTRRPYKQAFTPFYALTLIAKETGDYDPDLLKVFIRMLGKIK